jgi:hypothetical protein
MCCVGAGRREEAGRNKGMGREAIVCNTCNSCCVAIWVVICVEQGPATMCHSVRAMCQRPPQIGRLCVSGVSAVRLAAIVRRHRAITIVKPAAAATMVWCPACRAGFDHTPVDDGTATERRSAACCCCSEVPPTHPAQAFRLQVVPAHRWAPGAQASNPSSGMMASNLHAAPPQLHALSICNHGSQLAFSVSKRCNFPYLSPTLCACGSSPGCCLVQALDGRRHGEAY